MLDDDEDDAEDYDAEEYGTGELDDEEYDEFIQREFPDRGGGGQASPHRRIWVWTAWTLLAIFVLYSILSLA